MHTNPVNYKCENGVCKRLKKTTRSSPKRKNSCTRESKTLNAGKVTRSKRRSTRSRSKRSTKRSKHSRSKKNTVRGGETVTGGLGTAANTMNAQEKFRNHVCKYSLEDAEKALKGYSYYTGQGYTTQEQNQAYALLRSMRDNFMFTSPDGITRNFCSRYNYKTGQAFPDGQTYVPTEYAPPPGVKPMFKL